MSWLRKGKCMAGIIWRKHGTKMLIVGGTTAVAVGMYFTGKATLKARDIIDEHNDQMDTIELAATLAKEYPDGPEAEYTPEVERAETIKVHLDTCWQLLKAYAPAVSTTALGVTMLIGAYGIVKKQNIALMGAYKALEEGFNAYRKRVREEYGDRVDYMFKNGLREKDVEVDEVDSDGNTTKVKKKVLTKDPEAVRALYSFNYGPESSFMWSSKPGHNLNVLIGQENAMNAQLTRDRYLLLSTVLENLGIDRTPESIVGGWLSPDHPAFDPEKGNGFVDFGLKEMREHGWTDRGVEISIDPDGIPLNFNVDGFIADKVGMVWRGMS